MSPRDKFMAMLLTFASGCVASAASEDSREKSSQEKSVDGLAGMLALGQHDIAEADYALPAEQDPAFGTDAVSGETLVTQVAGRVYGPADRAGRVPLVFFMHGASLSCAYTPNDERWSHIPSDSVDPVTGKCPEGTSEIESYRGFDTAARLLASHGYLVVSINTNRGLGFSDFDTRRTNRVIEDRATLLFKTFDSVRQWDAAGAPPQVWSLTDSEPPTLRGRVDFEHVALVGHSRGADAVALAFRRWQDSNSAVRVRALVRIAAPEILDAQAIVGVPVLHLLGGCDGDVRGLDSALTHRLSTNLGSNKKNLGPNKSADTQPKLLFTLWGANHNFFNERWEWSEAQRCLGAQKSLWRIEERHVLRNVPGWEASEWIDHRGQRVSGRDRQYRIAAALIGTFIRAYAGADSDPSRALVFDPQTPLPASLLDYPASREFRHPHREQRAWNHPENPPSYSGGPELDVTPISNEDPLQVQLGWTSGESYAELPLNPQAVQPGATLSALVGRMIPCKPSSQARCARHPIELQVRWVYSESDHSAPLLSEPYLVHSWQGYESYAEHPDVHEYYAEPYTAYDTVVVPVIANAQGQLPRAVRFEWKSASSLGGRVRIGDVFFTYPRVM